MKSLFLKLISVFTFISAVFVISGCGPQAYIKGNYDEDVNRQNLLTDQWSETDLQVVVKTMVDSMIVHPAISNSKVTPVVMVTTLQNKTGDHIDGQSIMDMVRVELMKSGKVAFIDKEARQDIKEEYDYQNSGVVDAGTKKGPGGQVGSDYIVNGRIESIVQDTGKEKTVYYKITLNLTNLKTSVITWSDHKQIRKAFKKKSVGI